MSQKTISKKNRRRRQKNRIAPILLGLGGLVLVIAAVLSLIPGRNGARAAIEVNGAPSLKVDRELVDLGDQKNNQPVAVSFKVTNVGDQALRFSEQPYIEVVEGCCPPLPALGSMVLQPGESTDLSMEFVMHEGMDGMHDFRVHLPTNDPVQPDRTLTVLSNWGP